MKTNSILTEPIPAVAPPEAAPPGTSTKPSNDCAVPVPPMDGTESGASDSDIILSAMRSVAEARALQVLARL